MVIDRVDEEPARELRLEPGALRRHDVAGVRDGHELVDGRRVQRDRQGRLSGVDAGLELAGAPQATDEVDPLVRPWIADPEHGREHALLQEGDVERAEDVPAVDRGLGQLEQAPAALEVNAEGPGAWRR